MEFSTDPVSGRQYYVDPLTGRPRWLDEAWPSDPVGGPGRAASGLPGVPASGLPGYPASGLIADRGASTEVFPAPRRMPGAAPVAARSGPQIHFWPPDRAPEWASEWSPRASVHRPSRRSGAAGAKAALWGAGGLLTVMAIAAVSSIAAGERAVQPVVGVVGTASTTSTTGGSRAMGAVDGVATSQDGAEPTSTAAKHAAASVSAHAATPRSTAPPVARPRTATTHGAAGSVRSAVARPGAAAAVVANPGAFCDRPGLAGVTAKGTPLVCLPTSSAGQPNKGGRARWRAR